MSKRPCPIFVLYSQYINGQDFLDVQCVYLGIPNVLQEAPDLVEVVVEVPVQPEHGPTSGHSQL